MKKIHTEIKGNLTEITGEEAEPAKDMDGSNGGAPLLPGGVPRVPASRARFQELPAA